MKETTKIVSQREALHKYQYIIQKGDGSWEVRVWLNDDGTENPVSWNMRYQNDLKKKEQSKENNNELPKENKNEKPKENKKEKDKSTSSQKGYFGMSRWNPISLIIWIILLPFKIIWFILKFVLKICGIWFLISLFTGGDDND